MIWFRKEYENNDRKLLDKFFTNTNKNIFALKNLPDPIKGALLARYSRTGKSLRDVFLKEFANEIPHQSINDYDHERTKQFYEKVLDDYGDDSVAQLGSVHLACEKVSNIATKSIERGRMASYIEQSTRYQDYSKKPYIIPKEITDRSHKKQFKKIVEESLDLYKKLIDPKNKETLDIFRGLLPACMCSNVGIYANGQALERIIMRLMSSELQENRDIGEQIYEEANKVVPEYLRRIKKSDRGQDWIKYLSASRIHKSTRKNVSNYLLNPEDEVLGTRGVHSTVYLIEFDELDYIKIAASIVHEAGIMSFSEFLTNQTDQINEDIVVYECSKIIEEYMKNRKNRRHLPGRALEFIDYNFLVIGDYATFRDLQRHRIGTVDWGLLKTDIGYNQYIEQIILSRNDKKLRLKYKDLFSEVIGFHQTLEKKYGAEVAQYIVPMMFNIEYRFKINARQLLYMAELRMKSTGHRAYQEILSMMIGLVEGPKRGIGIERTNLISNTHLILPTSQENLIL